MSKKSVAAHVAAGTYGGEDEEDDARQVIRESETPPGRTRQESAYKGPPVRTGSFGPFPREQVYARWIEDHAGGTEVFYLCRDAKNWPDGCWKIESRGYETQYVGPKGLQHIAVEILGCDILEGATK